MSQYWLICVPNEGKNEQKTRAKLDGKTRDMQLSVNNAFKLPDNPQLKVGTIDQLMQLSDELSKIDTFVEATVKKIERTCVDLVRAEQKEQRERDAAAGGAAAGAGEGAATASTAKSNDPKAAAGAKGMNPGAKAGADAKAQAPPTADLKIERVLRDNSTAYLTPEKALEDFAWDMRRYHSSKGIAPLADLILKASTRADDELKNRVAEFNDLKQNVVAIERKEGGSLLVRPLGPYVRQTDIIEKDYLTTLIVVVPKVKEQEFLSTYELLESEAVARDKQKDEERKAQKAKDAEQKKAAEEAKAKLAAEKKKHAVAVQAKREKEGKEHDAPKESEEDAKRKEEEKKREEEEAKAEAKRREDEAEKKKKEEERRYACWNVVPGSAKKLTRADAKSPKAKPAAAAAAAGGADDDDDDEFCLYRVVVMRKGADSYRNILRDKRYTVRAFKYDPAGDASEKDKKKSMDQQKANLFKSLVGWCNATFSDIFNAWLHVKAMRLFVEAVLRYGLPIDFQCVLIKPKRGLEKRLREALSDLYSKLSGDSSLADQLDAGETDLSGMGADFYPYVYLPVTLSEIAPEKTSS